MYHPKEDHIDELVAEERQGEALDYPSKQNTGGRQYYIESYGCQMNFSDSEIVASILSQEGLSSTKDISNADFVFLNTCSIREKAEETVRNRLKEIQVYKKKNRDLKVGVLGCMAERLKAKFLEEEKLVDLVVGPDAYRDLPALLDQVETGEKGVNVYLSREETYADISPLRLDSNGVCAFISIMRGCDNMCSFCVVPFTRGRERSRDLYSIIAEAKDLFEKGYREVTLLGQNVDSYKWSNPETNSIVNFANLLEEIALLHPDLRVRFSTSHPKDITDDVIYTIAKYENICNYIHLPVQSGNSRILKLMNRTYDREWYINRIDMIYKIIPDCAISSDMIAGFCTETDEEHGDTLSIMEYAKYSYAYMFFYSERPGTLAAKKYKDDISEDIKKQRLSEIIRLQRQLSYEHNLRDVGQIYKVLIEGNSKKSDQEYKGRNSQNKMIIFPKNGSLQPGDYVNVKVIAASSATLTGQIIE
ncbi:MAG: tRNA (N6-isopentenyl adenosine(37)-C2)-methylthiotransferase MiaB [Saprospiraceae bacterium]|nr:tRNA (N6-isopentenyl adenosine(37)-C2)-methylthiotransferase MiaB [Saprospiraceae bacterium]